MSTRIEANRSSVQDPERQTRTHLMQLFEAHGLHPRSDLGQNFLIDLNLIDYIVQQADLSERDVVLEVGTGTGGLTVPLAKKAGHVVTMEFDKHLHEFAAPVLAKYPNVTLLQGDALKSKHQLAPELLQAINKALKGDSSRRLKLVANLPYTIGTPVISNLVATELPWTRMIATIQFELAQRMNASPQSEDYGALSVWLQSQCRVKLLKKLGPTVFWPRPKVTSAIVQIEPDPVAKLRIADRTFFHDFLRNLFSQRRKLLRGVLMNAYQEELSKPVVEAALNWPGLPETARAEELDVPKLVELCNRFYDFAHSKQPAPKADRETKPEDKASTNGKARKKKTTLKARK